MMTLISLLLFVAMLCAFCDKKSLGYASFAVSVAIGLYWFHHHATDNIPILL